MSATTAHNAILTQLQNDTVLNNEFGSNILKGLTKIDNIPADGRVLRVGFVSSDELESKEELSGTTTRAVYGFLISVGFYEPDTAKADERKTEYDRIIRNAIDSDRSFGGAVMETTEMGRMIFAEVGESEGYYIGVMPLVVEKFESIGNR